MLILTAGDVAQVYGPAQALEATELAAREFSAGHTDTPQRHALSIPEHGGEVLVMPGVVGGEVFGVKTWFALAGAGDALPATGAVILAIDPGLGTLAVMDAGIITDYRTGAMTALASRRLAPEGAETLAIIGAGVQAASQALLLLEELPLLSSLRVSSRTPATRDAFVADLARRAAAAYPGRSIDVISSASAEEAVRGAAIVVAATTSSEPVIESAWLERDVLVCGVGSHDLSSAEIPREVVLGASLLVVDTRAGGVDGAGDIGGPVRDGAVRREDVMELGELLAAPPAPRPRGVVVFKSVGFSAADVVSARLVLREALRLGLGKNIDLFR